MPCCAPASTRSSSPRPARSTAPPDRSGHRGHAGRPRVDLRESRRWSADSRLVRPATRCAVNQRYFNAGASDDGRFGEVWHRSTNQIPMAMKAKLGLRTTRCRSSAPITRTPDGTCIRDHIHVDDLAAAHVEALGPFRPRGGDGDAHRRDGSGSRASSDETTGMASRLDHPADRRRRPATPVYTYGDRPGSLHTRVAQDKTLDDIIGSAWAQDSTHP